MKHGTRRFTRRATKTPVQWFASAFGYVGATMTPLGTTTLVGFNLLDTRIPAVLSPESRPLGGRLRVERIVGQILLSAPPAAAGSLGFTPVDILCSMGIIVADFEQGAIDAFDPSQTGGTATTDMNKSWLWLHHKRIYVDAAGTNNHAIHEIPVDIRVRRVMRPAQALKLQVRGYKQSGMDPQNYAFASELRTLVSNVE